jgi:hypothetical protein
MSFDNGFINTNVIPRARTNTPQTFASGKNAIAICDRCGQKFKWTSLRTEPGTNYKVCYSCNDGRHSLVCHPQNFIATNVIDATALRWARPDQAPNDVYLELQPILGTEALFLIQWPDGVMLATASAFTEGYPEDYSTYKTNPFYLATEDGYIIEYDQMIMLELTTSTGPYNSFMTPPYGYD